MSTPSFDDPQAGDESGRPSSRGSSSETRTLVPFAPERSELMLAAVAGHANALKGAPLDQKAILASVRRRWFPAMSLGLIVGLMVGGIAYLVIPLTYTAFSELRISAVPSRLIFDDKESLKIQFETYR